MAGTKDELKARVESSMAAGGGRLQASADLRREVLEYSHGQLAVGRSRREIARDLSLNDCTLNRWHQNESKTKSSGPATFIEVTRRGRAASPKQGQSLVSLEAFEVRCPNGFEVRVPCRFEVAALRNLMAVVEGR
jgi:hypothetical protein